MLSSHARAQTRGAARRCSLPAQARPAPRETDGLQFPALLSLGSIAPRSFVGPCRHSCDCFALRPTNAAKNRRADRPPAAPIRCGEGRVRPRTYVARPSAHAPSPRRAVGSRVCVSRLLKPGSRPPQSCVGAVLKRWSGRGAMWAVGPPRRAWHIRVFLARRSSGVPGSGSPGGRGAERGRRPQRVTGPPRGGPSGGPAGEVELSEAEGGSASGAEGTEA